MLREHFSAPDLFNTWFVHVVFCGVVFCSVPKLSLSPAQPLCQTHNRCQFGIRKQMPLFGSLRKLSSYFADSLHCGLKSTSPPFFSPRTFFASVWTPFFSPRTFFASVR